MPQPEHHTIHVIPADSTFKRVAVVVQAITALGAIVALILVVITSQNESRDARRQAQRIQQSRIESAISSCTQSNQRHDATVRTLRRVYARDLKHPPAGFTRSEVQAQLNGNLFLINALVPRYVAGTGTLTQREHQGCTARARTQTRTP